MGYFWSKLQSPFQQNQLQIPIHEKIIIASLFFPSKESEQAIIDILKKCKKEMRICVYTITNKNILASIIEQIHNNKNLQLWIITDDVQTKIPSQNALLEKILEEGKKQVHIKLDISAYKLMHNKYLLIDDEIVLTGSFNWTHKAVNSNYENIVIIEDTKTVKQFRQNFDKLWVEFQDFHVGMVKVDNTPHWSKKLSLDKKTPRLKIELAIEKKIIKQKITKQKITVRKTNKKKLNDSESESYKYSDEWD